VDRAQLLLTCLRLHSSMQSLHRSHCLRQATQIQIYDPILLHCPQCMTSRRRLRDPSRVMEYSHRNASHKARNTERIRDSSHTNKQTCCKIRAFLAFRRMGPEKWRHLGKRTNLGHKHALVNGKLDRLESKIHICQRKGLRQYFGRSLSNLSE
jgi:hypothetical protein